MALASALACGWPFARHDLAVARMHRAARALVPEVVASEAAFGLLWCCSNHCDARVWVVVDAPGPEALRAARSRTPTLPGTFSGPVDWSLLVVAPDGLRDESGGPPVLDPHEQSALEAFLAGLPPTPSTPSTRFVVHAADQSYDGLDLVDPRCH